MVTIHSKKATRVHVLNVIILFFFKVMHARSGGTLEVMGLLQGKIDGDTMIVMDSFALPVEVGATWKVINFVIYPFNDEFLGNRNACKRPSRSIRIHGILFGVDRPCRKKRKCPRLVPFSPRLRMLVVWYRRFDTNAQSAVPRALARHCGT